MSKISYLYNFSNTEVDRIRVEAEKEHGEIVHFVVQYEAFIAGMWRAIIRYDTSHGFAHRDVIHPKGTTDKQPLFIADFNRAFTFAIEDLKTLWQWYREGYEKELFE